MSVEKTVLGSGTSLGTNPYGGTSAQYPYGGGTINNQQYDFDQQQQLIWEQQEKEYQDKVNQGLIK